MNSITPEQFYNMAASIMGGLCANPVHSDMLNDSFKMQTMFQNVIQNLQQALQYSGIYVEGPEKPKAGGE